MGHFGRSWVECGCALRLVHAEEALKEASECVKRTLAALENKHNCFLPVEIDVGYLEAFAKKLEVSAKGA